MIFGTQAMHIFITQSEFITSCYIRACTFHTLQDTSSVIFVSSVLLVFTLFSSSSSFYSIQVNNSICISLTVGLNSFSLAQVCSFIDHFHEAHFRTLCKRKAAHLKQSIFHYILVFFFFII